MATEMEMLKAMYSRVGIHYTEDTLKHNPGFFPGRKVTMIEVVSKCEPPQVGYAGFISVHYFDWHDGSLLGVGAWE